MQTALYGNWGVGVGQGNGHREMAWGRAGNEYMYICQTFQRGEDRDGEAEE